ncbi:phosphatidylinositol-4-phosphate 5-kinase-like, putative [Leishmania tarentolae]|uniref:Phosphatidylinositol-4-phosphate 5-kinase-like, putative n=1 Tax=Leishmania tarentolae TaxID=5689 RepID=A0A640KU63_LEITA|nr:phosphatidylinositol-4-phosphate 5-kinase-like, putative [Leishmania tarentolae]
MEPRDTFTKVSVDDGAGEAVAYDYAGTVPPQETTSTCTNETEKELQLRRLRRENRLLRLQLLELREQQHQLLANTGTAVVCPAPYSALTMLDAVEEAPQGCAVASTLLAPPQTPSHMVDEEATALRTRMLERIKERQQRTTVLRSLLRDPQQIHSELPRQEPLEAERENFTGTAMPVPPAASAKLNIIQDDHAETDQRYSLLTSCSSAMGSPVPPDKLASPGTRAVDDLSAEALLQRFQDRKSQRRLRLEKMLNPGEDATGGGAAWPIHGNANAEMAPPGAKQGGEETQSPFNSVEAGDGRRRRVDGTRRGRENDHKNPGSTAAPPYTGSTKNPNQIGHAVSDAVKNNSWYLCKVLEAALLDTIQARPVKQAIVPPLDSSSEKYLQSCSQSRATSSAEMSSSSSSSVSASSLLGPLSDGRAAGSTSGATTLTAGSFSVLPHPESIAASPTSVEFPQLLYPNGVSGTALKRAIEESLFLPFRCVQDAPRRLTSSQAAEENLPAFEAENRDAELRRCFGEGSGKDALPSSSARRNGQLGSNAARNNDEEATEREADMHRANDDDLDPFAHLLLARLSADLPSATAKSNSKDRQSPQYGSSKDGAKQSSLASLNSSTASSPRGKAGVSFVAAASGDRRVHIPKKHFSRLDEVQVEMHAPVIFNQIRDFLRMDVERFRRSFVPIPLASPSDTDGGEGTDPLRCRAAQTQQRLCVGVPAGTEKTTAWRISVSPGKSGTTLLYFSNFVMKTVRPSEMEFLLRKFLPAYVRYCERNPHTLLPRFYALATLRWWKAGVVQHFVLMQNVFATPYYIHRIYDVKGSTVNRTGLQPGKPPPRTAFGALLLKDNDLPPHVIICGAYQRAIMLAQLRSDIGFLRQLNVVDYSCLIGVRGRLFSRKEGPSKTLFLLGRQHPDGHLNILSSSDAATAEHHGRTCSEDVDVIGKATAVDGQSVSVGAMEPTPPLSYVDAQRQNSDDDVYVCIHGCDGGLLSLPIYTSGDDTTAREEVYYLGIIDVLQTYNSVKKLESFAKGFVSDRRCISVIAPDKYADRLYKVLERITV